MDFYKNISTDSLTLIKSSKQDLISIDYYKSPLNYKGYIYDQTKKKLTVYGLTDTTSKVFSYQNVIYLKNNGTYYIIKPTTVFAKYVILNDKAIIQELE